MGGNLALKKLSDEETEALRKIAYPSGHSSRLTREKMTEAILRVCKDYFLTASQLAQILERNSEQLRDNYLAKMVKSGQLELLYPHIKSQPNQAYRAVKQEAEES